jgi:uncharacterized protein YcbX
MHVAQLHIYPVKSLRGLTVPRVEIDPLGSVGDRRFMVVDPEGSFLTQRTLARMALVGTAIDEACLTLFSDGFGDVRVRRTPDPVSPTVRVRVWKSEGLEAEDCGAEPAEWLSRVIGTRCRLVRIGAGFRRPVRPSAARPGDLVAFADAFPFLAVTRASLDDLNARIVEQGGSPVPMDRFRPNIVVDGCTAFAEDAWKRVRVGQAVFRIAGPCARCVVTTTDQVTGAREAEPLLTLATYRRDPTETTHVNFGQNLVNESKAGFIRVGDPVEVID